MAFYTKKYYVKDKNGRWQLKSETTERCFSEYGRWKKSCDMEKKTGDKSFIDFMPTKSGLNYKVTQVRTYFSDGTKCVRELITTSNRLPRRKK